MGNNFFVYASHTIYPRFLCSGILWFAEHYFRGVLGSRLSHAQWSTESTSCEILRPPGGSVSQTIVIRYKEICFCLKHRKNNTLSI
jgi:hypothetical protein